MTGDDDRQLTLPVFTPMARSTDPATSSVSAAVVEPHLGKIQREVLRAFREHGPMTARIAEQLPEFHAYGFSTIRKRISELYRSGHLESHATEEAGRALVYERPASEEPR